MKRIVALILAVQGACFAQARLDMPMLGSPLPHTKFEVVNKIPAEKIAGLPKELPSFKWSKQPRNFPTAALQKLLDDSVFAGTNAAKLFPPGTNSAPVKLTTPDNQDYFIVNPAAGRIAVLNINRSKDYPPPDAVPDFAATWQRALRLAEMLGVTTNEMERNLDGSVHIRKTENTTSHLGGSVKYKSRRSVTVFRNIKGYLVRSLDEDKIDLELGVDGRVLRFDFKWPGIDPISTNKVLTLPQIVEKIKSGEVLSDDTNEYPAGGVAEIELKDFQIFYYVSTMFPYGRRMITTPGPDIRPMIDFLVTFKSSNGEKTEGDLFAPLTEQP